MDKVNGNSAQKEKQSWVQLLKAKGNEAFGTTWGIVHFALAIIHLVVAIAVGAALHDEINTTAQDVFFTTPTIKDDGDSGGFEITTETEVLFRVSPILIHVIVSALTGFSHLTSFFAYSDNGVCKMRPNKIRWVEYAVTATLMTLSGYISLGEGDIMFLTTITLLGFALQFCGYLIEQNVATAWYPIFMVALFIELAIVLPMIILTDQIQNRKQGLVVSMVFYGFYYSLFAINCLHDAWRFNNPRGDMWESLKLYFNGLPNINAWGCCLRPYKGPDRTNQGQVPTSDESHSEFMKTDKYYAVLSFTSKQALFWITIAMVMIEAADDDAEQSGWDAVLWLACALPLLGLILYWLHSAYPDGPVRSVFSGCWSVLSSNAPGGSMALVSANSEPTGTRASRSRKQTNGSAPHINEARNLFF